MRATVSICLRNTITRRSANVINVPAKKKRRGIDPFTKVEREFAAKPATVKIKTRALKKLKDAAL